jgi:hypothetical protein
MVHESKLAKVLSRDEVRDQFGPYNKHKEGHIMEICKHSVQGWLVNGEDVLFDSTALDKASRMRIIWWAKEVFARGEVQREVAIACLFFPCRLEDALARRKDVIPEERIREMQKRFRKPDPAEGAYVMEVSDPFTKCFVQYKPKQDPGEPTTRRHRMSSSARGLVICETPTSTWNYHLREISPEGLHYGGPVNTEALCGKTIGWDTRMRLSAWGRKDHIPSTWCADCEKRALELLADVEIVRIGGNQDCEICGKVYYAHPDAYLGYDRQPILTRLCDGRVVKL